MGPRAIFVAIVIAITVVVSTAWFLGGDTQADVAHVEQREQARPSSTGDLAPALSEERTAATAENGTGDVVSAPREHDVQPPASSAESEAARSILLAAREQGTETPVAGAELVLFEEEGLDFGRLLRRGALDIAAATRVLVADELGQARIPVPRIATVIYARKDGLAGYLTIGATQTGDIVVPMVREGAVRVEVVDLLGQPLAGVAVTLRRRNLTYVNDYGIAATDAAGAAVLEHARMLIAVKRGPAKWSVAVRGVFDTPIEVPIDEGTLDGGSLRLSLPAFGSCDVLVRDERGEALGEPFDVVLDTEDDTEKRRDPFLEHDGVRFDDALNGVAHFPVVQIGRPLVARVRMRTSSVTHTTSGLGPSTPGANAVLVVELAHDACVLTGRVQSADGAVPRNMRLLARIDEADGFGGWSDGTSVRLDEIGRFRVAVQPQEKPGARTLVVFARDAEREETLSATFELPETLSPSVIDVGVLTLKPPPLLAAGTVVDAQGVALSGVDVLVSIPNRYDTERWSEVRSPSTHTDEQGRFELRTSQRVTRFQVVAHRDGATAESGAIAAGSTDVVLRMPLTGSLGGRVLLDGALAELTWIVRACCSDEGGAPEPNQAADWQLDDGGFELGALSPGDYDVSVIEADSAECVARVQRVRVVAAQLTRDPRLNPIDLRSVLNLVELSISAESGERLREPWVIARAAWPDGRVEIFEVNVRRHTTAPIVCADGGVDVRVGAEGCAEVELSGVTSNREVVLRSAPLVVVTLPDGTAARDGAYRLGVQLVHESFRQPGPRPLTVVWFDDGPRVELTAPVIGTVLAEPWIWTDKSGRNAAPIALDQQQHVEVAATGTTLLELRVTPADIERALAALRDN